MPPLKFGMLNERAGLGGGVDETHGVGSKTKLGQEDSTSEWTRDAASIDIWVIVTPWKQALAAFVAKKNIEEKSENLFSRFFWNIFQDLGGYLL